MSNHTWEQIELPVNMNEYLRGTHKMWTRVMSEKAIYTVLPNDKTPGPNDGGYASIDAALKVEGMCK